MALAFPIIALSKQLVYSSIFHCIGAEFGFSRYGTLLGLAKRSGRDPRDIYSRTCYRLIARIGDELGDEAFRLD